VSNEPPIAKAYMLLGCPFCFKFMLFMTEAGLLDQIELVSLDRSAADYGKIKTDLEQQAGRTLSFPTVEVEPGVLLSDTQALIEHYSAKNGLGDKALPVLAFYQQGLFQNVVNLYKENMAFREQLAPNAEK
jgi:hypothetical protein